MDVRSILNDSRINAVNILIEISIGEYIEFANEIVNNNEYQRKKVIKSKIKEILQTDLLKGCVMPSIVLAVKNNLHSNISLDTLQIDAATEIISQAVAEKNLLIIDGLQRTYTILEIVENLKNENKNDELAKLLELEIRCEVYAGLNRTGLLYRMITLNTGQTSMSTRHLMEILYHDYQFIKNKKIKLITDKEDSQIPNTIDDFSFKTTLDGFVSYLDRDENIYERTEILQNTQNLGVFKEANLDVDLFERFIETAIHFIVAMSDKIPNWNYSSERAKEYSLSLNSLPFGNDTIDIWKKSQVFTGFGAALGFLRHNKKKDFDFCNQIIDNLTTEDDNWDRTFYFILQNLDYIKERSKKIGNDQRFYFKTLFKNLLNPDSDNFRNMMDSAKAALDLTDNERLK